MTGSIWGTSFSASHSRSRRQWKARWMMMTMPTNLSQQHSQSWAVSSLFWRYIYTFSFSTLLASSQDYRVKRSGLSCCSSIPAVQREDSFLHDIYSQTDILIQYREDYLMLNVLIPSGPGRQFVCKRRGTHTLNCKIAQEPAIAVQVAGNEVNYQHLFVFKNEREWKRRNKRCFQVHSCHVQRRSNCTIIIASHLLSIFLCKTTGSPFRMWIKRMETMSFEEERTRRKGKEKKKGKNSFSRNKSSITAIRNLMKSLMHNHYD